MFCPFCGVELRDGAKFCGQCGEAIPSAAVVETPAPAPAPVVETPAPAAPAPVAEAPAPVAPAPAPAAPAYAPAPAYAYEPAPAAPAPEKKKKYGWRILQLLLLASALASVVFLFVGIFGYTAGANNNRFSLFGLCTPFAGSEICLSGQHVFAGPDFLTWDLLFYIVGGIALVGLLFVLLATLLKKPKLNIPVIISSILLAAFAVVMFFVFRDTLVEFLTNYVVNHRLSSLSASADLKECGFVLAGLCALNVVLAVLLAAFGGKKKKTEPAVEVSMI